jgi:hypothetical protein
MILHIPEAIDTFIQPETDNIMNSFSDFRVLPIQIRLLWREEMQIILI